MTSLRMLAFRMNSIMIVAITIYCIVAKGERAKTDWEGKLISDLLWDYHPSVAPTDNGPVQVQMGFGMGYFDFIDEPKQLAIAHGFSYRVWKDPRLQWNETEYNGTRRITLDRKSIWIPDIEVHNSAKAKEMIESRVLVFSSGTVRFYLSLQIEFLCHMDLTYFPYDNQTCDIKFGSWHYTNQHINLTASQYIGTNASRVKSAKDFQMTSLGVQRNEISFRFIAPYSFIDVTYTIGLKRLSGAYSTKLVMPSVLTGFLILATFLIPNSSGEKITLCSILFLCNVVLIAYVHTIVPSTGETVLGQLLAFSLFVDFFAIILAVVSYNVTVNGNSVGKNYDMMMEEKPGGGGGGDKASIPLSRKLDWLRYIDVISFVVFSLVFVVGIAIILTQRS